MTNDNGEAVSEQSTSSAGGPINITDDDIKNGLLALVIKEGEDFVYSKRDATEESVGRCVYVHQGKPDCIVGQFLAGKGVPVERLEKADTGFAFGQSAFGLLDALEFEKVISISRMGKEALLVAQSAQDRRETWGAALDKALNEL
jgi:hypothetical protein